MKSVFDEAIFESSIEELTARRRATKESKRDFILDRRLSVFSHRTVYFSLNFEKFHVNTINPSSLFW